MIKKYFSKKSSPAKGFILSLAGTLLVSTNFVTAKYGLYGFEPVSFGAVWTLFSALFSLIFIMLSNRSREILLPRPDRAGVVLLGAATGFGMIWGWTALSMLDPSFNAFLNRFVPVLTVILGVIFLNERITFKEVTAIVIMLAGGVISSVGSWSVVASGVFFAGLACAAVSFQHLIAKKRIGSVHVTVMVFYRSLFAFILIASWGLIRGGMEFGAPGRFWAVTALGALLGPCISHILYYKSFSYWTLARSSLVSNVQPLFVLPLAYVFLGEFPGPAQLAGGMIILAGIFRLVWIHRNIRPQPET